jgi:type IV pilus assembly protein PilA
MFQLIRRRLDKDEQGFTLIELMVVVLIIAILIAIAIPTFLGAQNRARDRGAQSNLRNALTAAKTIATDSSGKFSGVDATTLTAAEGSLKFVEAAPETFDKEIVVVGGKVAATANADYVLFYNKSASGTFFGIATNSSGQVGYCSNTTGTFAVTAAADLAGCNATSW